MSNKEMSELSKPVAYDYQIAGACIADGHNENGKWVGWYNKLTRYCPPDWMVEEGKVTGPKPLYSQEYVSALLAELEAKDKRIAELEQEPSIKHMRAVEESLISATDIATELEAKLAIREARPSITHEAIDRIVVPLNPDGLDEEKHHCEWHLYHDRERIRKELREYFTAPPATAAPESTASHGLHQEQPSP